MTITFGKTDNELWDVTNNQIIYNKKEFGDIIALLATSDRLYLATGKGVISFSIVDNTLAEKTIILSAKNSGTPVGFADFSKPFCVTEKGIYDLLTGDKLTDWDGSPLVGTLEHEGSFYMLGFSSIVRVAYTEQNTLPSVDMISAPFTATLDHFILGLDNITILSHGVYALVLTREYSLGLNTIYHKYGLFDFQKGTFIDRIDVVCYLKQEGAMVIEHASSDDTDSTSEISATNTEVAIVYATDKETRIRYLDSDEDVLIGGIGFHNSDTSSRICEVSEDIFLNYGFMYFDIKQRESHGIAKDFGPIRAITKVNQKLVLICEKGVWDATDRENPTPFLPISPYTLLQHFTLNGFSYLHLKEGLWCVDEQKEILSRDEVKAFKRIVRIWYDDTHTFIMTDKGLLDLAKRKITISLKEFGDALYNDSDDICVRFADSEDVKDSFERAKNKRRELHEFAWKTIAYPLIDAIKFKNDYYIQTLRGLWNISKCELVFSSKQIGAERNWIMILPSLDNEFIIATATGLWDVCSQTKIVESDGTSWWLHKIQGNLYFRLENIVYGPTREPRFTQYSQLGVVIETDSELYGVEFVGEKKNRILRQRNLITNQISYELETANIQSIDFLHKGMKFRITDHASRPFAHYIVRWIQHEGFYLTMPLLSTNGTIYLIVNESKSGNLCTIYNLLTQEEVYQASGMDDYDIFEINQEPYILTTIKDKIQAFCCLSKDYVIDAPSSMKKLEIIFEITPEKINILWMEKYSKYRRMDENRLHTISYVTPWAYRNYYKIIPRYLKLPFGIMKIVNT